MKKDEKKAEKFGSLRNFLYLCRVIEKRDFGHPVQLAEQRF